MNNSGIKMKLFEKWIKKTDYLEGISNEFLLNLGETFKNNVNFLYSINHCITNQNEGVQDNNVDTKYTYRNEISRLELNNQCIELPHQQMKLLLAGMIDIFEEMLPLGSVVDLKKDYFANKITQTNQLSGLRIVVMYRFLFVEGDSIYFPYAGIPYPIGITNPPSMIHFISKCIDRIVHLGYADETEQEFIEYVKEELLVNRCMHSVNFADESEIVNLKNKFNEKEEESLIVNKVEFI